MWALNAPWQPFIKKDLNISEICLTKGTLGSIMIKQSRAAVIFEN